MPLVIEDGSGLATAEVYDASDDAAAWLLKENPASAFAALDGPARDRALLKATRLAESGIRRRFRGRPLSLGQALLFPSQLAIGQDGSMFDAEDRPSLYRQGIFLLAEYVADGTAMAKAQHAHIKSELGKRISRTNRDSVDLTTVAANHPDVWDLLRTALPP